MNFLIPSRLLALVLLLTLVGCRTYGGYETEAETVEQIHEANRVFAAELERARADLLALEQVAGQNASLGGFHERFYGLVTLHEALLNYHRDLAAEVEGSGSYREISRALGAISTENHMVRGRYRDLLLDFSQSLDSAAALPGVGEFPGRYFVTPPYYARASRGGQLPSVSALLNASGNVLDAAPDASDELSPGGPPADNAPASDAGLPNAGAPTGSAAADDAAGVRGN